MCVCVVRHADIPAPCHPHPQGLPGDDELLPPQVEESPEFPIGRITIHCTAARWAGRVGMHEGADFDCAVLLHAVQASCWC